MAKEEIRCPKGKLLAEIDVELRELYLFCKYHKSVHEIALQPFIDRMLAHEAESTEQDEGEKGIRLLRAI